MTAKWKDLDKQKPEVNLGRLEQQFYQAATFFHVLKILMWFVHKTGDLVCMGMLQSVTRPFSAIFARGPGMS